MNKRTEDRHSPADWLLALDSSTGRPAGLIVDLSSSGMHLLSHAEYEEGQEIPLTIKTPPEFDGPRGLHVRATCRWCRRTADGRFDAGMEFDEAVTPHALATLVGISYRRSA